MLIFVTIAVIAVWGVLFAILLTIAWVIAFVLYATFLRLQICWRRWRARRLGGAAP
jgi:hypothetical protein